MQTHLNVSTGAKYTLTYHETCVRGINELEAVRNSHLQHLHFFEKQLSKVKITISPLLSRTIKTTGLDQTTIQFREDEELASLTKCCHNTLNSK